MGMMKIKLPKKIQNHMKTIKKIEFYIQKPSAKQKLQKNYTTTLKNI